MGSPMGHYKSPTPAFKELDEEYRVKKDRDELEGVSSLVIPDSTSNIMDRNPFFNS